MVATMRTNRPEYLQVGRGVVGTVLVPVVDDLPGRQEATEHLFHDIAMLMDVSPAVDSLAHVAVGRKDADIAALIDKAAPLPFRTCLTTLGVSLRRCRHDCAVFWRAAKRGIWKAPQHVVAAFAKAAPEWLQQPLAPRAQDGFARLVSNPHLACVTATGSPERPHFATASTRSIKHTLSIAMVVVAA